MTSGLRPLAGFERRQLADIDQQALDAATALREHVPACPTCGSRYDKPAELPFYESCGSFRALMQALRRLDERGRLLLLRAGWADEHEDP